MLGRLITIFFAILLCIAAFAATFELLNAIGVAVRHGQMIPFRETTPLQALGWGLLFRAPGYLYFGTLPLLLVFLLAEWRSLQAKWAYIVLWALAGVLATSTAGFWAERAVAAVLAGSFSGYLYWRLVGRSAGAAHRRRSPSTPRRNVPSSRYLAYAILCYLAYQSLGYAYYGSKLVWVTLVSQPDPGTPPFRVLHEREMTPAKQVAVWEFPDAESCLKAVPADLSSDERLLWMDWERIQNDAEAEVCMFRLLGSYQDLSHATAWFEAQGFNVHEQFSSANPSVERDGKKRVAAQYSIRKNGPKFPARGAVRRMFRSISYSMSINSTWSPDGKQLLGVTVSYLTL